ncbi:lamin tail domain-containing protein [Catellatospora tritici]|uniref:lamin tail domain-containing protein n=1 Tax=Catellatospora tritici TaxID=2851566 RepID=UPI001C2CF531|nr:lamin tail domain-containing protein [Catellatospora tritici]MBV1850714.1 lamin tail domain-containing protein [Catellatospora tritici]MBV1850967.1 lamin tail domain-containing protein [Catellatospora tritici]
MRTHRRDKRRLALATLAAMSCLLIGVPAAADDPAAVRVNEVESSGGSPGDWVELFNAGTGTVDLSGWIVRDNDDTHTFTVPAGTTLAAGAYLALDVETAYGLGGADSARLYLPDGMTLIDSYAWTAHAATTYGRCPDGTGAVKATTASTKGAANDCSSPVRVNEVESSGGSPGDWVELFNGGATAADLSGWIVRDNDDTHTFTVPAGTSIAAGGFLALDVESAYGLGGADSARLFLPDGVTLVDSYTWTAHATTTYGRCPDATGAFAATTAPTKGSANACAGQTPASTWPGGSAVATADAADVFGGNMSGLAYQGSGVLWAVKNGPGTLYRLVRDGANWTPDPTDGWASGKALHYADGTGDLDSEGVALSGAGPAGGVYVATERDNAASGVSLPKIVRFDVGGTGSSLDATAEWNLTADLPTVGANAGLEGITWIPDSYLVAGGFRDERTGSAYRPADYPGHGDGLFFVGLEANGSVYAYALDQAGGAYTRVATFASGFPGVMDLVFEPETGLLWTVCDDTCHGRTATFDLDAQGRFAATAVYERPAGMPDYNNEGFTIAPQSECVAGFKAGYWSDDTNDGGHALRAGTLPCTDLDADDDGILDAVDPAPTDPANATFADAATSGRIVDAGGRQVTVADAAAPAGVRVDVGAGTRPVRIQLTGSAATISLGQGAYVLTGTGVAVRDGEPAVVAVTVKAVPVELTVGLGGSVVFTETTSGATVTGLTGIGSTGPVTVRATTMAADACTGIAVRAVIVGSTANEVIDGSTGADLIVGVGGNDVVNGNGGDDCVATGSGNDVITTAGGSDWIDAGNGNNVVRAGSGANTVRTGSGNDTVTTGDGADIIDAGNGNNSVNAGAGDDRIVTGTGNDAVDCGAGADAAFAGRGNNANAGGRCETFGV